MNEEEGVLAPEARLHHQVGLVLLAPRHVGEDLLVQGHDAGLAVQGGGHVGQEQVQELQEEGGKQLFEQAVVVHDASVPDCPQPGGLPRPPGHSDAPPPARARRKNGKKVPFS